MNESKLSKQQKEILRYIEPLDFVPIKSVSWYIAKKFNNENDNKIWSSNKQQIRFIKEMKEEKNHDKDFGARLLAKSYLIGHIHKQESLLKNSHSASFSRSLRLLDNRGLIFKIYGKGKRTVYLGLTDKGKKVLERLNLEKITRKDVVNSISTYGILEYAKFDKALNELAEIYRELEHTNKD